MILYFPSWDPPSRQCIDRNHHEKSVGVLFLLFRVEDNAFREGGSCGEYDLGTLAGCP